MIWEILLEGEGTCNGVFYHTSQFLSRPIMESKRRKKEERESDAGVLLFEPFRWKVVVSLSSAFSW